MQVKHSNRCADFDALTIPFAKIAVIVPRDDWHDVCADLFGHSSPITVVRFSPVVYGRTLWHRLATPPHM